MSSLQYQLCTLHLNKRTQTTTATRKAYGKYVEGKIERFFLLTTVEETPAVYLNFLSSTLVESEANDSAKSFNSVGYLLVEAKQASIIAERTDSVKLNGMSGEREKRGMGGRIVSEM
eukprot:m.301990 g.301990  ORF g.301990 m.301990 type:complete len:117 (+) comp16431_c0_seq20:1127-1477(+)